MEVLGAVEKNLGNSVVGVVACPNMVSSRLEQGCSLLLSA